MTTAALTLTIKRYIDASPEFLFDAWTSPERLLEWWGPKHVECCEAVVELHTGGILRLGNRLPSGDVLTIVGEFVHIERPSELVYTWSIEGRESAVKELVTVSFQAEGDGTQVQVVHERIANEAIADDHRHGWEGCLDGLAALGGATPG